MAECRRAGTALPMTDQQIGALMAAAVRAVLLPPVLKKPGTGAE
jgi:hypothetical protein